MNLLAIETTGAKASAAWIDETGALTVESSDETMNHLQHLIPMIDQLLSNCGKSIDDVSVIAISQGPGSFTGIRIGMATAKALAQVRNVPVVCVPTLESFAYHLPDYRGLVCPVFDARRSQVYAGVYQMDEGGVCRCLLEDGAYDIPDYLEGLRKAAEAAAGARRGDGRPSAPALAGAGGGEKAEPLELMLFGDGIAPCGQEIEKAVEAWNSNMESISSKGDLCLKTAEENVRYQSAASVARLGAKLFTEGKCGSFYDAHPVYLRKAEAERKLEEAGNRK